MMAWIENLLIASFCIVSLTCIGIDIWKWCKEPGSSNKYLGYFCILVIMNSYEGLVKIFMVIMLAICLIKYGMAHRQTVAQSLKEHYTLTPNIMYPVFIAASFTALDTVIYVLPLSVLKLERKEDALNYFLVDMVSGFCDFTLKLSIMIAYYLIIKHVYMKLEQAKWPPSRGDSEFKVTNFDEIAS